MAFFESENSLVEIDLSAISYNLRKLYLITHPKGCKLMPIVKSDAYGHGLLEVTKELLKHDIWGLGIYELEEAAILRQAGIGEQIFLLSGLLNGDAKRAIELDLTIGIVAKRELCELNLAAKALSKRVNVHLKVDTGMGRFGLLPNDIFDVITSRSKWPYLNIEGLYSHFSCADDEKSPQNIKQLRLFKTILRDLKGHGFIPRFIHMANSAAIFNFKESLFNLARPGIAIYGAYKRDNLGDILRPALSFSSKVVDIKELSKGSGISYGHTTYLKRDSKVALVPVGYDNGFLRALSNRADVLIKGKRCKVLGAICMKTIIVDVTHVSDVEIGERVTLIGEERGNEMSVVELADRAGTISYELLCLIGKLNRRRFVKSR